MRAVVQRVTQASVAVEETVVATIGPGMLVLLAVEHGDDRNKAQWLATKLKKLRIFADDSGKMNEPLGTREVLCVSQFTLCGDTRRGTRPSFKNAAPPEFAEPLYTYVCALLAAKRGVFGAQMEVSLVNDGPVTLIVDTP